MGRALCLLAGLMAFSAQAHLVRTTAILLDVGKDQVVAEVQLPMDQLTLAMTRSFSVEPASYVATHPQELNAYAQSHFGATAPDGRPFGLTVTSSGVRRIDDGDCFVFLATLRPPEGVSPRSFTLHDTLILQQVMNHRALVSVRHDFENGLLGEKPEWVGVLDYQHSDVTVERAPGSFWRGLGAVVALGARHISEGTDHLLFLLALLLPAPLLVLRRRWGEAGTFKSSLVRIAKIVTAFTLGHSLTLAAAATGALRLPSQPVEVLIALSILVSAAHAARPLFPGREPLVAAGFGLVHGLAFATVLAGMGLDAWTLAVTILGFNVGIELMQCAIVAVTLPSLLLLSRTRHYRSVRLLGASISAVAACGWVAERALGLSNPVGPWVEQASHHAGWAFSLLAVGTVAAAFGALRPGRATARSAQTG